MIGYVMVGTNHLDKAIIFYDDVLKELNLKRVETDPEYAAYAPMDKPTEIEFYVTKPFTPYQTSQFFLFWSLVMNQVMNNKCSIRHEKI